MSISLFGKLLGDIEEYLLALYSFFIKWTGKNYLLDEKCNKSHDCMINKRIQRANLASQALNFVDVANEF